MRVGLRDRPFVSVSMMLIVDVSVFVLERLVLMLVAVPFGQMKPEAEGHQHAGNDQLRRHRLVEQDDRDCRAEERREREIGSSPGGAEIAQRQDEQNETDADAEEPDDERRLSRRWTADVRR